MKRASSLLRLLALPAAFLVVSASLCQKKPPERQWERGSFQSLPANTQLYQWPAGVVSVQIVGADDASPMSDLPLLMTVHNSGQDDVDITFPAGLVFGPSPAEEYQYMILLQDCSFTAPGGSNRDVLLPTYCCNADSSEPDDASFYIINGREWDRETEELLNLVADKALSGDDAVTLVQDALFEITDEDGLTDSTKAELSNLP
ncbi:MAG: hypothetical protein NTX53_02585 [candidate division WOR-3 bacterium]|nr:hypothetical protein [candidate division WOR-3 bacterium]